MAKVTILSALGASRYPLPVPVISFNEWNGLAPGERHTYPLGTHHVDVQRIYVDDIEEPIDASYRMFDYIDALKIFTFLEKYPGQDVLVHCAAGVSRSPACAKFMIDYLGYELDTEHSKPDYDRCHNTHVYYTLKRAIFDHPRIQQTLKVANDVKTKEV